MPAADDYRRFIQNRPAPDNTVYINTVRFHINPTTFRYHKELIHVDVPTRGGYGRFFYGTHPPTITLDGHTGTAGVNHLREMESAFAPLVGKTERLIPFRFPARFGHRILRCYVNIFEDSIADTMHLYNQYHFELVEYPFAPVQSAIKITHNSIDIHLPVSGS